MSAVKTPAATPTATWSSAHPMTSTPAGPAEWSSCPGRPGPSSRRCLRRGSFQLPVVLLAIPLFIMAGAIMEKGKIAAPLVSLAELFVGHLLEGDFDGEGGVAFADFLILSTNFADATTLGWP